MSPLFTAMLMPFGFGLGFVAGFITGWTNRDNEVIRLRRLVSRLCSSIITFDFTKSHLNLRRMNEVEAEASEYISDKPGSVRYPTRTIKGNFK